MKGEGNHSNGEGYSHRLKATPVTTLTARRGNNFVMQAYDKFYKKFAA